MLQSPWVIPRRLSTEEYRHIKRRAIFDFNKWDPHAQDAPILADFPLIITEQCWREISGLAEKLFHEALEAESELIERPELIEKLGLRRPIRKLFPSSHVSKGAARTMRFDFHLTNKGWVISEANTDVPGGYIESSGFTQLMASLFPGTTQTADPSVQLCDEIFRQTGRGCSIAMVHATAFTDDRQVMVYLAKHLEERGLKTFLVSPEQIDWEKGQAHLNCGWSNSKVDMIIRFYPGEWLPHLPRSCDWSHFFIDSETPQCNPGTSLLIQSKRFPLIWDQLSCSMQTWKTVLPETRDPDTVDWQTDENWVLKPAFGRVGEGIGISGVTDFKIMTEIKKDVMKNSKHYVAQKRFQAIPVAAGLKLP